jgi:hypothetical protein
VAGQGAVIDLHGETVGDMLVRDRAALYAAFTPDAAEATGEARGGLAMRLREAFEDARFYAENTDDYRRGATRDLSMSRLDLEAMAAVLDGGPPGPATSTQPCASRRSSTWICASRAARRPGCGPTDWPRPTCR